MKRTEISISGMVFINITALIGIRFFVSGALYGAEFFILWLLSAILFFLPISMMCADLSVMYPEIKGGFIGWMREILGERNAYYASWMYYSSYCLVYLSGLSFMALALAYAFGFKITKEYLLITIFISLSFIVYNCLQGTIWLAKLSRYGAYIGRIIPTVFLLTFACICILILKDPIPTNFSLEYWLPKITLDKIIYLSTLTFAISGIEMSSPLSVLMKNPKKNYPKAILITIIAVMFIYMLGSFSMLLIESPDKMRMSDSLLRVFIIEAQRCNLLWVGKIICLCVALSFIAEFVTIMGLNLKLLTEGNKRAIPAFFLKPNRNGVQYNIIIFQTLILSFFLLTSYFLPTVEIIYLSLLMMLTVLVFIPYLYLIAAYYKIRIIGNKKGISFYCGKLLPFVCCIMSFVTVLCTILLPIISPPKNSILLYEIQVIGGPFVFIILGWILHKYKWNS